MRRIALTALAAIVASAARGLAAPWRRPRRRRTTSRRPSPGVRAPTAPLAGRAECGFVTAPLDYAQPGGEKIKIAVSRVKHKVADAKAQGPMLVNPGGPGGAGLVARPARRQPCPSTRATPTTGSASTPAASAPASPRCPASPTTAATTVRSTTRRRRPAWSRRGRRGPSATRRPARPRAARCSSHLTTADAAKDLDTIRKALGAKQINFYGFSYGTYLGQVYATLFPQNLRRAVFDGVVDHRGVWYQDNLDQDVAFQKAIEVYFDWIAKNDAVYHLGNSGDAVEKLLLRRAGQAARRPRRAARSARRSGPTSSCRPGYYVSGWEKIATTFAKWVQKRDVAALDGALRRHGLGGRRQRLRDLPRRPVHRHALAAAVRPGARRQRAGGAHGAVRDVGQRLVQRTLPDVEGARAASRCRSRARPRRRCC